MWHKFKKDLFSYYSMQKVNGVMGVNGIMRTCHKYSLNIHVLHVHMYTLNVHQKGVETSVFFL